MDWFYEAEYGNNMIIADAVSGGLEACACTDRSKRNVLRCLRKLFSPFGMPFTIVSDNGKEFLSKDLKNWLAAQGSKKNGTPLYSLRSIGVAEKAVQTLKRSLKFYNKDIGCSLTTYNAENFFSHRSSSIARSDTPVKSLFGKNWKNLGKNGKFLKLLKKCCTTPLQTMIRRIVLQYPERMKHSLAS